MTDKTETVDPSAEPEQASAEPEATPAELVEAQPDTPDRTRRVRRWWPALVAVVALLVMVGGLLDWSRASGDSGRKLALERDAVLIAATAHIETLNSLDYQHVDAGLAGWSKITTGTLHDQLSQVTDDERKLLADQKKISTGKVLDAAVFSLSDDTATVVASVEVTVKDGLKPDEQPTVKRNRFSADLVDVHGTWLVEKLQQVAVDIS
jgi:Mce-associated membrane protein